MPDVDLEKRFRMWEFSMWDDRCLGMIRSAPASSAIQKREFTMIMLGLVLLIIGLVAAVPILTTIGIILLLVGLVLNFVPIGGTRRRYY